MKSFIFAALLAITAFSANAADVTPYASVGTQGIGGGVAFPVSETTNARVEFNGINISHDFTESNVRYSGKIKNNSISALYDWHLISALPSVRVTGGIVYSDGKVNATGTTETSGSYEFNGVTYGAAAGENVQVDAKFKKTSPYIGVGFGDLAKRQGLSFFGDVGAFYAKPSVNVTLSPGLSAVVPAADLQAETVKLQDKVDNLKWYPVVRFGVQYKF